MRRRKFSSKVEYSRDHSKRRAQKRYGISINRAKYREIIQKIKSGLPGVRLSHKRFAHIVEVDSIELLVVYDVTKEELVTVLPRHSDLFEKVKETLCTGH
jgi:hypothetical protein